MNIVRYGVFNLAQIWTVVGDEGVRVGFPTRDLALDAAGAMAEMHRGFGTPAEVVVQDELGFFCSLPLSSKTDAHRA